MNSWTRAALGVAATGVATVGYAAGVERRHWTLREVTLPVLPPGTRPLKVLHLSDLHMTPGQRSKQRWVAGLAELEPDLVVDTGDNLAHPDSVPFLVDALGDLLGVPGAFVFGSNDYFAPTSRNPVRYLLPDDGRRVTHTPPLPWRELRDGMTARGLLYLTNAAGTLKFGDRTIAFAGVDDSHLRRDR